MITDATPIFASSDVLASIAFYKDVLGFDTSWTYGDPPGFGCASTGAVSIMFNLQSELAKNVAGHQHWIGVKNADEIYARHIERGAKIISEIEDKPWGVREYTVEDPDGYHLRFAGPVSSEGPPSKSFPTDVILERRRPTVEEYIAVAEPQSYSDEKTRELFHRAWGGVVALAPKGCAIGTVRVMNDAPGWFSIWDVAVRPEWQGRHIGQRLMEEAIDLINAASPGAWVYLFTYKHGFYERLGFKKETVCMRRA